MLASLADGYSAAGSLRTAMFKRWLIPSGWTRRRRLKRIRASPCERTRQLLESRLICTGMCSLQAPARIGLKGDHGHLPFREDAPACAPVALWSALIAWEILWLDE